MQVDLGCLVGFVSEPESDHRAVDPGRQQSHGAGVSQDMRSDTFGTERRTATLRHEDVLVDQALDSIAAERCSSPTGEQRAGRRSPQFP